VFRSEGWVAIEYSSMVERFGGKCSVTFAKAQYDNLVCIRLEGSEVTGLTAPI